MTSKFVTRYLHLQFSKMIIFPKLMRSMLTYLNATQSTKDSRMLRKYHIFWFLRSRIVS